MMVNLLLLGHFQNLVRPVAKAAPTLDRQPLKGLPRQTSNMGGFNRF